MSMHRAPARTLEQFQKPESMSCIRICTGGMYTRNRFNPPLASFIPALHGPNMTYVGPSEDKASICTCSSVTYSLISACAFCQGGQVPRWSEWTRNCPRNLVYNGEYLHTIPPGTVVPGWAYTPISNRTDRWDVANALSIVENNPHNTSTTSGSSSTSGKLFNTIPDSISSSPTSSFTASTTVPTLANSSPAFVSVKYIFASLRYSFSPKPGRQSEV
ncbi:hypothetical protein QCA50_006082 [Cerrena zonata]|uniref:Uncharacterized protein n=1 Tax=Cerrena zonata TaxID=2478898 RepID=A0AAW0GIJ5_9APHY